VGGTVVGPQLLKEQECAMILEYTQGIIRPQQSAGTLKYVPKHTLLKQDLSCTFWGKIHCFCCERVLPIPGEAKAKAMPGRLYIHTR
jgi:hypothetical protein